MRSAFRSSHTQLWHFKLLAADCDFFFPVSLSTSLVIWLFFFSCFLQNFGLFFIFQGRTNQCSCRNGGSQVLPVVGFARKRPVGGQESATGMGGGEWSKVGAVSLSCPAPPVRVCVWEWLSVCRCVPRDAAPQVGGSLAFKALDSISGRVGECQ